MDDKAFPEKPAEHAMVQRSINSRTETIYVAVSVKNAIAIMC